MTVESQPTQLSMTVLMTPDMAHFAGNVHGGALLRLLDQVAYTCASRYARTYVATLSLDRALFREVVHVGELVTFNASVNYVGRTSMEVGIRVEAEDLRPGVRRDANSSYFTTMSVDAEGRPTAVPPLARRQRSAGTTRPASVGGRSAGRSRTSRLPRPSPLPLDPVPAGGTMTSTTVETTTAETTGVPAPRTPAAPVPRPADACHCGEAFAPCRGCGAARCPACEPVRDDDCLWGV